jgi:hypothetical protein
MASLTETAYYTRRAINWGILAIISYVVLRFLLGIFVVLWLAVFPPKAPPPTHAFNVIPKLVFPPQATPSGQLTFQLETITGHLPKASESAAVYFMPKAAANLLALTKTQQLAQRLGFDPTPIAESKNIYRFNDTEFPLRRLRYDIVSSNFVLRYAFERDPILFVEKNLPTIESAKIEALSMLQNYDLYNEDLAGGTDVITYLRLVSDKLVPTTSLSQSDAVRIDFFRKPVGNSRIYAPYPEEAPVSIVLTGSTNQKKRVLQFAYTFWPIDYLTKATYALKTPDTAWQELQNGQGYIARYPKTGSTALVRNVTIGYYDSFEPQTYLQPIYVFEGDDGFLGYVPAVSATWVQ